MPAVSSSIVMFLLFMNVTIPRTKNVPAPAVLTSAMDVITSPTAGVTVGSVVGSVGSVVGSAVGSVVGVVVGASPLPFI